MGVKVGLRVPLSRMVGGCIVLLGILDVGSTRWLPPSSHKVPDCETKLALSKGSQVKARSALTRGAKGRQSSNEVTNDSVQKDPQAPGNEEDCDCSKSNALGAVHQHLPALLVSREAARIFPLDLTPCFEVEAKF